MPGYPKAVRRPNSTIEPELPGGQPGGLTSREPDHGVCPLFRCPQDATSQPPEARRAMLHAGGIHPTWMQAVHQHIQPWNTPSFHEGLDLTEVRHIETDEVHIGAY